MKKKICFVLAALLIAVTVMFAEYRFIMLHICPYDGDNSTVYLEIFGQVDEYYAAPASELYE